MATKFSLVFVAVFVVLLAIVWDSQAVVVRREATTEKSASQAVDEAIQSFKTSLDDWVKNVQILQTDRAAREDLGKAVKNAVNDLSNDLLDKNMLQDIKQSFNSFIGVLGPDEPKTEKVVGRNNANRAQKTQTTTTQRILYSHMTW